MELHTTVKRAAEQAIVRGDTPGAVVLIGRGDETLLHEAYGERMVAPEHRPMEPDTVFDLASVTKPVATATVFAQLMERGRVGLRDRVAHWLPEYRGPGRERATLWHLLTHSSGLPDHKNYPDFLGWDMPRTRRRPATVSDICRLPPQYPLGQGFTYSCLGFILLTSVIEAAAGQPLDRCFREWVARPLGLRDTSFNPPPTRQARCAATEQLPAGTLCGLVHDENARFLGGVGGNAGLFGTAGDLARFLRMLLGGGELEGVRVLQTRSARALIRPQLKLPDRVRGLGWDIDTDYSPSLRGVHFSDRSFGHSGYTGTSVWADPTTGGYAIILTNRVHYGREASVQQLRRQVSDAAGKALQRG